ncbi:MAG TPA: hypothetical protein VMR76_01945 [Candidatus Saccharimonadia bacterium]|nr:hypothetical protein [Candidatus Saccharimonadia bacterium]
MSTIYAVNQNRWAKLGILDQMGNIYSEVGRSFKSKDQKDHDAAVTRAIDLFDSTVKGLVKQRSPRAKEVLRAKEQFLAIVSDSNSTKESIESLDRYFMQFAIAARINR